MTYRAADGLALCFFTLSAWLVNFDTVSVDKQAELPRNLETSGLDAALQMLILASGLVIGCTGVKDWSEPSAARIDVSGAAAVPCFLDSAK